MQLANGLQLNSVCRLAYAKQYGSEKSLAIQTISEQMPSWKKASLVQFQVQIRGSILLYSVGDPDLEPDSHVFGPPGSISQRYGSGSFSFLIKVLSGLK